MREIYEETSEINWDKKVTLELSLWELQMIKDSIGSSYSGDTSDFFNELSSEVICPYKNGEDTIVYQTLKEIVERNGGIV